MKDKYYEYRFPRYFTIENSTTITNGNGDDVLEVHAIDDARILIEERDKAIDMIIALGNALEIADDATFRRIMLNETTEGGK